MNYDELTQTTIRRIKSIMIKHERYPEGGYNNIASGMFILWSSLTGTLGMSDTDIESDKNFINSLISE